MKQDVYVITRSKAKQLACQVIPDRLSVAESRESPKEPIPREIGPTGGAPKLDGQLANEEAEQGEPSPLLPPSGHSCERLLLVRAQFGNEQENDETILKLHNSCKEGISRKKCHDSEEAWLVLSEVSG